MDIISYAKSQKAKKKIGKIDKNLGHGNSNKHGSLDIKGNFSTTEDRLSELEFNASPNVLNKKIKPLTEHVSINLNKHNLKVKSLSLANNYRHKNMLFDDLLTLNNIDSSSSNISHNSTIGTIKQNNTSQIATLKFKKEANGQKVNNVTVSVLMNEKSDISLAVNTSLFHMEVDENGFYPYNQTFITEKIQSIPSSTIVKGIDVGSLNGTSELYYSTQVDENGDEQWRSYTSGKSIKIKDYIRLKINITTELKTHDYNYSEVEETDTVESYGTFKIVGSSNETRTISDFTTLETLLEKSEAISGTNYYEALPLKILL